MKAHKVVMSDAVVFQGTGSLQVGNFDSLRVDKTTKQHQRWLLHKSRKNVPDLQTYIFANGILLEKLEKLSISAVNGLQNVMDSTYQQVVTECEIQMKNARSDTAHAIDRYTCF